jgi:hypothetical protein
MERRMLLTLLVVLPLVLVAVYGIYRVANEDEGLHTPPDSIHSLSDWAFPAVG